MKTVLQLGVAPEKIIYAQTIKPVSHLKYALSQRISTLTFDNEAEVYKIKEHFQSAK
jgi:ornithine decarboxylase